MNNWKLDIYKIQFNVKMPYKSKWKNAVWISTCKQMLNTWISVSIFINILMTIVAFLVWLLRKNSQCKPTNHFLFHKIPNSGFNFIAISKSEKDLTSNELDVILQLTLTPKIVKWFVEKYKILVLIFRCWHNSCFDSPWSFKNESTKS